MIIAYFSDTKKYLQKDNYKKEFDVSNLVELVSKIKIKEPVLIRATQEEINNFKVFNLLDGDFTYEVINDVIPLTSDIVNSDLQKIRNGEISYVLYKTKAENRDLLGDKVYIVDTKKRQQYFIQNKGILALTLDDLKEKVNLSKVVELMFNGKEVK